LGRTRVRGSFAEGSFEGTKGGVDEGMSVGIGAAGFDPAQAGLVEEAEVAL
jgi:hypothetical protein